MRLEWSSIRAITKHPINYLLCDTRVLSPIPPFHQSNTHTHPDRNDHTQLCAVTCPSDTTTAATSAAISGLSRQTFEESDVISRNSLFESVHCGHYRFFLWCSELVKLHMATRTVQCALLVDLSVIQWEKTNTNKICILL